jgi:Zn-dependent protease
MQIQDFALIIPIILLSLTVHEYAHGWVAYRFGDPTARDAGRLTFNPIPHLDFMGTTLLLLTTYYGYGSFGWAKPVPVNGNYFANPKRDSIWVSLAGPVSNILLALLFGYTLRILNEITPALIGNETVLKFFKLTLQINLGLAFFNLIPIPPLDGSHILLGLLPNHMIPSYLNKMRFMPMIFMGMLVAEWVLPIPIFSFIMNPIFNPFRAFWYFVIFWHF